MLAHRHALPGSHGPAISSPAQSGSVGISALASTWETCVEATGPTQEGGTEGPSVEPTRVPRRGWGESMDRGDPGATATVVFRSVCPGELSRHVPPEEHTDEPHLSY